MNPVFLDICRFTDFFINYINTHPIQTIPSFLSEIQIIKLENDFLVNFGGKYAK